MIFKPYYYFETGCAAYLVGCGGLGKCAVGMSGKPSSTIAFEKRWNPPLGKSRDELVEALADLPSKPEAMKQMLRINQGREGLRS